MSAQTVIVCDRENCGEVYETDAQSVGSARRLMKIGGWTYDTTLMRDFCPVHNLSGFSPVERC